MLMPLKWKYRCPKAGGSNRKKGGGNGTPKKKTIWKLIQEAAKRKGKK